MFIVETHVHRLEGVIFRKRQAISTNVWKIFTCNSCEKRKIVQMKNCQTRKSAKLKTPHTRANYKRAKLLYNMKKRTWSRDIAQRILYTIREELLLIDTEGLTTRVWILLNYRYTYERIISTFEWLQSSSTWNLLCSVASYHQVAVLGRKSLTPMLWNRWYGWQQTYI